MEQRQKYICKNCKTTCWFTKPNNGWILWMGWIMIPLGCWGPPLVFLWPPGLILVIMGYRQRKPTCASCKSRKLIPTSTPMGAELLPKPVIGIGIKTPPSVLHIHCPNGHQLETPREMLAQEAMCPHCGVQFELKESQSVEAKSKREKELDRQWNRIGNRWLTWSITVVIIVVLTLFVLIVTTF